jgi:MmyB-like transcription regulator ligand binding domain
MLRLEAGRNPHDPGLISLVGELSTQSELFRQQWASRDVKYHRSGTKRLHHPVVGDLDLNFESMELPSEPGLVLNVYTAPAGSPSADALRLLASWAATHREEPVGATRPEALCVIRSRNPCRLSTLASHRSHASPPIFRLGFQ